MLTRELLTDMFARMRADGWQPEGPLLWGYFFTDTDARRLEAAGAQLATHGYRLVDIFPDEHGLYWLHVERVEAHTVASLHARNQQLAAFAKARGLQSYDGLDVGRVPS